MPDQGLDRKMFVVFGFEFQKQGADVFLDGGGKKNRNIYDLNMIEK